MNTRPKLRRRDFWLLLGACVLVLLLVPVVRHYQLRATARAYVAQLRAQGEKLDLAEVVPPSVPPEQDSSALLLQAIALLDRDKNVLSTNPPLAMHMVAPGRARISWQQPAIVNDKDSNSWAEVETVWEHDSAALALLRQIPPHPSFDFNLPYQKGFAAMPLKHLAPAKGSASHLSAAALMELHRGDPDAATQDIRAMLAVVNGMAHDRLAISELVRLAIAGIANNATWELLQATNVTESELSSLQQDWAGLEFIQAGENALLVERAAGLAEFAPMRQSNDELMKLSGPVGSWDWNDLFSLDTLPAVLRQWKFPLDVLRWRYWWSYADEIRTLQGEQVLLETYRQARTNASLLPLAERQDKRLEHVMGGTNGQEVLVWLGNLTQSDLRDLMSSSVWSLRRTFAKVMRAETSRRMTITAIALKRYQLKHGQFPENLEALTPDFLPAGLLDPMSGKPFHYRRDGADDFLLYSVGDDGMDDGGDATNATGGKSLYWLYGKDWVWPQPGR